MMFIVIEYAAGIALEAVVLSMEPNRLRVAVAGFSDALAFTRSGPGWVTEGGERVDLGFVRFGAGEASAASNPTGLALAMGAAVPNTIQA